MDASIDHALAAMPVYVAGVRFDGTPALSHEGDAPTAETEVWFADQPDRKMTVLDAEDLTDVSWFGTPKEYEPPRTAAMAPFDEDEDPEDGDAYLPEAPAEEDPEAVEAPVEGEPLPDEVPELSEAELDEIGEAVTAAEDRVGQLEGLVAGVILAGVTDDIFVDPEARAASAPTPTVLDPASGRHFTAGMDDLQTFLARVAALPPAAGDLPPDLNERIETVTERLIALEESVGKLMLDDVADEELPTLPEGTGTFVDETLDDEEDPEEESDEDPAAEEDEDPEDDSEDDERYPKRKKKKAAASKPNPFAKKG